MTRKQLFGRIYAEIQESEAANRMKEDECRELADKVTEGVVSLLINNRESVEGLFNGDSDEQPEVVVIDKLLE